MKRLSIFLFGALAVAATSCDEAPAVPPMQETSQPGILAEGAINGEATGVLASSAVFNMESVKENPLVEVIRINEQEGELPEGAVVSAEMQLASTASFENAKTLAVEITDGVGYINANDWHEAHLALFGKSPKEKSAYWRIPLFVTLNGTTYRYNNTDWYAASGSLKETCMDAGFVVYDGYYLLGNATTWDLTAASEFKFSHSSKDVYDDPVFTYTVEVTQDVIDANGGGCYWKIAAQPSIDNNNWDTIYGPEVDGDDNLAGMLTDANPGAGKISEAGKYRLTINMEEMTYNFELLLRPEFVAVPSNANGWGQDGARLYWSNKDDKPYFCGAATVNNTDGGFKFIWDNNWYGGADGIIDAAGGNIPAPIDETRLYWFTVSTDDMTYTITEVETLGVIGGGNWSASRNLTPSADYLTWEGDVEISGEWKLIFNNNWSMNYGGSTDEPVFDGANINSGDGLMHVVVSFAGNTPTITVTAK